MLAQLRFAQKGVLFLRGMDLLDKLRAISRRMEPHASVEFRPFFTTIESVVNPGEVIVRGHRTLMFGSNNYFGLTSHPEVIAAAKEAIDLYGSGTTGSRIANGTFAAHESLERDFARFFGMREASIFTTGYQANLSMVGALCGPGDVIMLDAESHASLCDAARLSGAEGVWVQHNSPKNLATKLKRLPKVGRNRLVVVEGLYSIRGDVAPLREIVEVRARTTRTCSSTKRIRSASTASAGSAARKSRAFSIRSISWSGRFRRLSAASAASACRIIRNYAKFISQLEHTRSPRPERRPASPACAPPSRSSGGIVRSAIACGRTFARFARDCTRGLRHRPVRIAADSRVHRPRRRHDRALAGSARGRRLREHRRAARMPEGSVPAADELSAAHTPAQIEEAVALFRRWASLGSGSRRPADCSREF